MPYFSKSFLSFFKELEKNNHKPWFDENRKTYETEVREPMKVFVTDVHRELAVLDPFVATEKPYKSIFRINRDIRFSKDKTPYKTQYSAVISGRGTKGKDEPALYMELSPLHFRVYGGFYMGTPQQVNDIRYYIADRMEEFKSLYTNPEFVNTFGTIQGQQQKRLSKELMDIVEQEPLILNKQFYFYHTYPASTIHSNDLLQLVISDYQTMLPLTRFLRAALGIQAPD